MITHQVNLLLMVLIFMVTLYLTYGAFFRDFGKKNYEMLRRLFPSVMVWPRSQKNYATGYKIVVVFALASSIVVIVLMLVRDF